MAAGRVSKLYRAEAAPDPKKLVDRLLAQVGSVLAPDAVAARQEAANGADRNENKRPGTGGLGGQGSFQLGSGAQQGEYGSGAGATGACVGVGFTLDQRPRGDGDTRTLVNHEVTPACFRC